jgi:hypothetical protein
MYLSLQIMLLNAQWRRHDGHATRVIAQEPGIHWFEQFNRCHELQQREVQVTRFQSGREGLQEDVPDSEWGRRQTDPEKQSRRKVHRDHNASTVQGQRVSTLDFKNTL